jgi:hypothetical protein
MIKKSDFIHFEGTTFSSPARGTVKNELMFVSTQYDKELMLSDMEDSFNGISGSIIKFKTRDKRQGFAVIQKINGKMELFSIYTEGNDYDLKSKISAWIIKRWLNKIGKKTKIKQEV